MSEAEGDNETWIVDVGGRVIDKKAAQGYSALSPLERLIYCVWVADYSMRNAGDLATAADLYPAFLDDGKSAARELDLPCSVTAFSLRLAEFEQEYFGVFDQIVSEIRAVGASCNHEITP